MWKYNGRERPPFADAPGPGQESVWDYPRPPTIEVDSRSILVTIGDTTIAETSRAFKVMETASPPTFYIPLSDFKDVLLIPAGGGSVCEWKGLAKYFDIKTGDRLVTAAAWTYPSPSPAFSQITDCIGLYPSKVKAYLDGEPVQPQHGAFYGGWVTNEIVGPFKGLPGTSGW